MQIVSCAFYGWMFALPQKYSIYVISVVCMYDVAHEANK